MSVPSTVTPLALGAAPPATPPQRAGRSDDLAVEEAADDGGDDARPPDDVAHLAEVVAQLQGAIADQQRSLALLTAQAAVPLHRLPPRAAARSRALGRAAPRAAAVVLQVPHLGHQMGRRRNATEPPYRQPTRKHC